MGITIVRKEMRFSLNNTSVSDSIDRKRAEEGDMERGNEEIEIKPRRMERRMWDQIREFRTTWNKENKSGKRRRMDWTGMANIEREHHDGD